MLSGIVKKPTDSHTTVPQPVVAARNAGILFLFVLCLVSSLQAVPAGAMDRFAALGMLESGNNDLAIGPAGEVTRYQIKPDVWHEYSNRFPVRTRPLVIAQAIMRDRIQKFGRQPSDLQWYLLWNCPGDISKPSRRELARAQRFQNLCWRRGNETLTKPLR